MRSSLFTPPDLTDLVAQRTRRWRGGRRARPFRFLVDGGVFRLLCGPGQTAARDNFRASLAQLRLAPEGGLPDLEMTPLAILDVIGVEPPSFPALRYLPESMATLRAAEVAILLKDAIEKEFGTAPELEPENLRWRVEALREATDPAAHEVFDLCLTRFVAGDTFRDEILAQLALDTLFTFRYPEEYRERMTYLFNALLLSDDVQVAGLTKVRRLAGELRPRIRAWTPGWLVPCRADGTFEAPVSTGEMPVWAGPSPPAPLPRAGEGRKAGWAAERGGRRSPSFPGGGRRRRRCGDREDPSRRRRVVVIQGGQPPWERNEFLYRDTPS